VGLRDVLVVLGAGPAGLALAMRLLRRGDVRTPVVVIEQQPGVGGLAASFEVDGLYLDHGSHRLHPATDPEILADVRRLLGPDLLVRPRHGRIRLRGRYVRFPLSPIDLAVRLPPSFIAGVGRDAVAKALRRRPSAPATFAEALLAGLGPTICTSFYFPYARKLWGLDPTAIAVEQAQRRVSANSIGKMVRKALSVVPGLRSARPAIFYYPRRGYGQISDALAGEVRRLGGTILLSTQVRRIVVEEGHVRRLLVATHGAGSRDGAAPRDGADPEVRELEARLVFSTIPVTALARLLAPPPPDAVMASVSRLTYRAMVLVYLVLDVARFTPYDAHYFPEEEVLFSRVSEPKNYSMAGEPAGRTGLCVEVPCAVGDEIWSASEEEIHRRVVADLARVGLPVDGLVRTSFTRRLPHVYPVYDRPFQQHLTAVGDHLARIGGLVSLGRQGLFAHDNTHHTIEMAYRASECLRPDLSWDGERWEQHRQQFRSHVVED
jgi:protoporphyrinogen oxidase